MTSGVECSSTHDSPRVGHVCLNDGAAAHRVVEEIDPTVDHSLLSYFTCGVVLVSQKDNAPRIFNGQHSAGDVVGKLVGTAIGIGNFNQSACAVVFVGQRPANVVLNLSDTVAGIIRERNPAAAWSGNQSGITGAISSSACGISVPISDS